MYRFVFLVLILTPTSLFAFNRGQTCISRAEKDRRGPEVPSNAQLCNGDNEGRLFYWNTNILTYSIHEAGSLQFPGNEKKTLFDEMRLSFQSWEGVECTSLRFEEGELSTSFGHKIDRKNWIGFYNTEDWPNSRAVVSVTTITTQPDGLIVDVDIEINSKDNVLGIDGGPLKYDIRNFLNHEVGHFIGLDHSPFIDAAMQYQTIEGQIKKRDLHTDDEAGVCEIYPLDFTPIDIDESDGCCSTYRSKPTNSSWIVLSLLFIVAVRRR